MRFLSAKRSMKVSLLVQALCCQLHREYSTSMGAVLNWLGGCPLPPESILSTQSRYTFLLYSQLCFSMTFKILYDPAQIFFWSPSPINCQHLLSISHQSHGTGHWHHKLSLILLYFSLKYALLFLCHLSTIQWQGQITYQPFWRDKGSWVLASQCSPRCTNMQKGP